MNNKILVGFVVLVGGAIAGWYLLGSGYSKGTPASEVAPKTNETTGAPVVSGEKTSISYGTGGFTPATVTVKVGTTVRFANDGSAQMWVASAVHPTHQVLPGFDQLTSVGNGGSYEYTFTKVGTWKYHNHVNPSETGTVIVTE